MKKPVGVPEQLVTLPGSTSRVPPTSCKRRCAANAAIFLSWCTRSMVSEDKKHQFTFEKKKRNTKILSFTLQILLLKGGGACSWKTCGHCSKVEVFWSKKKPENYKEESDTAGSIIKAVLKAWKFNVENTMKITTNIHNEELGELVFFLTILAKKKCAPGISEQRIPTTQARVFIKKVRWAPRSESSFASLDLQKWWRMLTTNCPLCNSQIFNSFRFWFLWIYTPNVWRKTCDHGNNDKSSMLYH